jgi:methylmalonyl-CoA mutase N-terminal domain/subunit
MTNKMEAEAQRYFAEIEAHGGVIECIGNGYIQQEITDASARYQREIDERERTIVGVNDFVVDEPPQIPILRMDPEGEQRHLERLRQVRLRRDNREVGRRLAALREAAAGEANTMPSILDAVRAYATLGEVCQALREVFGEYRERSVI